MPEVITPGVFVQESPGGERSIERVETSIAAIVGHFEEGPANKPVEVTSLADFVQSFGPLDSGLESTNAVRSFFDSGGRRLYVSRTLPSTDTEPGADDLIGDPGKKTGLHALDAVDLLNVLLVPAARGLNAESAARVVGAGLEYAASRRAFMIVDLPNAVESVDDALAWSSGVSRRREARNGAAYFPALEKTERSTGEGRLAAPSGAVAGVYARVDRTAGVWKAPAGTDASIQGATGLALALNDADTDRLNRESINSLREMPGRGILVWGARTMAGSSDPEWIYVPVRRTALFLEESLHRGLQWAVFEPNAEPLWAVIRLSVGAFMDGLFRQGAFQGQTPREAYFVKVDSTTVSQADIDRGVCRILVGFAPLKPAEFVTLTVEVETLRSDGE